jgi:hypothetical protein
MFIKSTYVTTIKQPSFLEMVITLSILFGFNNLPIHTYVYIHTHFFVILVSSQFCPYSQWQGNFYTFWLNGSLQNVPSSSWYARFDSMCLRRVCRHRQGGKPTPYFPFFSFFPTLDRIQGETNWAKKVC